MPLWLLIMLSIAAAVAAIAYYAALHSSEGIARGELTGVPAIEDQDQQARHLIVEEHGTELMLRRLELDDRRGALAGDVDLWNALEKLDARHLSNQISEEEYESEKIRLLGG